MTIRFYPLAAGGVLADRDDLDVEIAQANCPGVFAALGFPVDEDGDYYGDAAADTFLGRVLLAQALAPYDTGVRVATTDPAGRIIDGGAGTTKGYLQTRLMPLADLARWCVAEGYQVAWA